MPKINVYLPDDLAAAVRRAGVPVSAICQQALGEAVRVAGEGRDAADAIRAPGFNAKEHPQVSAAIAARTTPRVRQALRLARGFAGTRGHAGGEHLLLGMIDEGDNLGIRILQLLDVDVPALRDAAKRAVGPGRKPRLTADTDNELLAGLSSSALLVIAAALDGATDLGHSYLGSEHLLLGLADQADSAAGGLLAGLAITPERVRRAIPAAVGAAALGYQIHAGQTLAPPAAERLDRIDRRLDGLEQRLRAGGL